MNPWDTDPDSLIACWSSSRNKSTVARPRPKWDWQYQDRPHDVERRDVVLRLVGELLHVGGVTRHLLLGGHDLGRAALGPVLDPLVCGLVLHIGEHLVGICWITRSVERLVAPVLGLVRLDDALDRRVGHQLLHDGLVVGTLMTVQCVQFGDQELAGRRKDRKCLPTFSNIVPRACAEMLASGPTSGVTPLLIGNRWWPTRVCRRTGREGPTDRDPVQSHQLRRALAGQPEPGKVM